MAENATIGALRVVLGADTAQFEDGLKKASNSASNFAKSIGAVFGGVELQKRFDQLTHAIYESVKGAFEYADQIGKTAQKVGVSTEELSKLKYAADLSDVSLETLSQGLGKLAKDATDAAGGSDSAQAKFSALGVSATDAHGKVRPMSELVADIAGKFASFQYSAEKTAIALDLFGKSGKELIPLLNSGKQGIADMAAEAELFGLVVTEKSFKQMESFNDNIRRLDLLGKGFANTVAIELAPALNAFTNAVISWIKQAGGMHEIGQRVRDALAGLITVALSGVEALNYFTIQIENLKNAATALGEADLSKFRGAIDAFSTTIDVYNKRIAETPQRVRDMMAVWDQQIPDAATQRFTGSAEAAKKLNDELDKLRNRGLALTEETISPFEHFQETLGELDLLLDKHMITLQTYNVQVYKAATTLATTWGAAVGTIGQSFADMTQSIAGSNTKAFKIAQVFAAATALVQTLAAQAYALSQPFPANLAAMAVVAAKGAAIVAAIRSTQAPTMAAGGSFMVPGGSSGVDNRVITMALAAGERVDVTPASRSGAGDVRVVRIEGLERPRYTLDEVKGILDVAGQAMRDGYRFEIAS